MGNDGPTPLLFQAHGSETAQNHPRLTIKERPERQHSPNREATETAFAHCDLSEPGSLAAMLGEKIYTIDSIAVTGPINDADFNTLWDASFNGHLRIINIENTTVENNIIPEYALFHKDAQVEWETWTITVAWLEKLILPEGVTEIGDGAFAYATRLHDVNFPTTLKSIGKSAFTDCYRFEPERLVFPKSLEHIGEQAFYQCRGLTGEVVLPETLQRIDCASFYNCRISEVNIPQSLEFLGCLAFAGSRFKKAILPDNCYLCSIGGQFANNWEITEVHLPEKLRFVPSQVVDGCISLTKVNVPANAVSIEEFAYNNCAIDRIDLPATLEHIGQCAFQGCENLKSIVLPASLTNIGNRALACYNLKSIYCMATVPPVCDAGYDGTTNPFSISSIQDNSTPVYIPMGTKDAYTSAPDWNSLSNYIETDRFPAGINTTLPDATSDANTLYDLQGRKAPHPASGHIYISKGKKFTQK